MAGQEVVYLQSILHCFRHKQLGLTAVWEDNTVCIQISLNQVNSKFTQHIDLLRYYVRDLVTDRVMVLVKCAGTHNVADALMKSLPGPS
eukprot:2347864-Rhodomonas_salina.1